MFGNKYLIHRNEPISSVSSISEIGSSKSKLYVESIESIIRKNIRLLTNNTTNIDKLIAICYARDIISSDDMDSLVNSCMFVIVFYSRVYIYIHIIFNN